MDGRISTVPRWFESANHSRGLLTEGGAPAMSLSGPMPSFQKGDLAEA